MRRSAGPALSALTTLRLPAVREDRSRFAALRDKRVLIYWPHGLGDWVTFGAIAPLLESSNTYAITRFGDDFVSLMEGNAFAEPLFSGARVPNDGASRGARHLGLNLKRCDGRTASLELPPPLDAAVARFGPEVLLWTDYPETEGRTPYPFHTKARNLVHQLVSPERIAGLNLAATLANAIDFSAPHATQQRLDERLRAFAGPATRLGVISRSGLTAARKNWGDGSEARTLVEAMRRQSPQWRFISMDDEDLGDSVAGFRRLFGDLDDPFARLYKALSNRVDLFVGIPAGPLHFTLARGGIPTVGVWIAHHPDWYDEPNAAAIHLVGRYVRDRAFERRPATTSKPPSLQHRLEYLDTRAIPAEAVAAAAWELLR
jgi:hypothetical protein